MSEHVSSLVLRKHLKATNQHQESSSSLFQSLPKDQKLGLLDRVRLKNPKPLIRKESSIFYPSLSNNIYTVQRIKRDRFPYLYCLAEIPNRTFYAWQLVKIDENLSNYAIKKREEQKETSNQIIDIKNVTKNPSKILRNNKPYGTEYIYEIVHNNSTQFVDRDTLILYKKLFHPTILRYSNTFYTDPNLKNLIV